MPRRRMIDPQIWRNEKIGRLSDTGRLLFIGIFSQADDDGRLRASPAFLMANIFPYDKDKTEDDIRHLRDECAKLGLIRIYNNGREEYLDIPGWYEHQQIRKDRYEPSKLPSIDEADETSQLNQPTMLPTRDNEHAMQHTLAQRLRANEWQPTNEKIKRVETNKRLGNLYADIVALTETQKYILIEVKVYPLQPKDLGQVVGYRREMEKRQLTPITTFLIGGGLGKLTKEEADQASVKIVNLHEILVATTNHSVKSTVETTDIPNIIKSSLIELNREPSVPADQEPAEQPRKSSKQKPHQKEAGAFLSLVEKHEKVPLLSREKLIHLVRTKLFRDMRSTSDKLFECYLWLKDNDFFCRNKAPPQVISAMPDRYPSWLEGKLKPSVGGKSGEYRQYPEEHGTEAKYDWQETPEPDDTS